MWPKSWRTSKPHPTSKGQRGKLGPTHTDTERYDHKGKKDKSARKLKVSGKKYDPSMKDIQHPD